MQELGQFEPVCTNCAPIPRNPKEEAITLQIPLSCCCFPFSRGTIRKIGNPRASHCMNTLVGGVSLGLKLRGVAVSSPNHYEDTRYLIDATHVSIIAKKTVYSAHKQRWWSNKKLMPLELSRTRLFTKQGRAGTD